MTKNTIKWNGHTHTEMCRHGSGDSTAKMVEKAIEFGYKKYTISEHAPLPPNLLKDKKLISELSLLRSELPEYFKLIDDLKRIYGNKIEILSAFEVDYLPDNLNYTTDMIDEWKEHLDEILISIHFMKCNDILNMVDYEPDDFKDGLIKYYGSIDKVHIAYWDTIYHLVCEDFNFPMPVRIGHITVIRKFIKKFPLQNPEYFNESFFEKIMKQVKKKGYSIDFNVAGYTKEYCKEPYMIDPIYYWIKKLEIDLVYGSDAHGISHIGHYYDDYIDYKSSR